MKENENENKKEEKMYLVCPRCKREYMFDLEDTEQRCLWDEVELELVEN